MWYVGVRTHLHSGVLKRRKCSKLKGIYQIKRGIVVFLEDATRDFIFRSANWQYRMAEAKGYAMVSLENVSDSRKKRKLKPTEVKIVVPHIAPTRSARRRANMVSLYCFLIQQKAD